LVGLITLSRQGLRRRLRHSIRDILSEHGADWLLPILQQLRAQTPYDVTTLQRSDLRKYGLPAVAFHQLKTMFGIFSSSSSGTYDWRLLRPLCRTTVSSDSPAQDARVFGHALVASKMATAELGHSEVLNLFDGPDFEGLAEPAPGLPRSSYPDHRQTSRFNSALLTHLQQPRWRPQTRYSGIVLHTWTPKVIVIRPDAMPGVLLPDLPGAVEWFNI